MVLSIISGAHCEGMPRDCRGTSAGVAGLSWDCRGTVAEHSRDARGTFAGLWRDCGGTVTGLSLRRSLNFRRTVAGLPLGCHETVEG